MSRGPPIVSRLIIRTVVLLAGMAALLFMPAGTVKWPAAWALLLGMVAWSCAMDIWFVRHDPGLLSERLAPLHQPAQKHWDKILITCAALTWAAWLAFMPLDAVRFGWSHIPAWVQGMGALSLLLMAYLIYLTFRENTFAAPVVKIQKERGHKVVTTGPYRYVRHPMYAGVMFFFLGTPLLLGSWYGVALAPLMMAFFVVRAVMEERMLVAELEGYADYAARVRYRLVPLIW
jgi:protein-S-isoprenylcysteine O-methyltransferase Ste14